MVQKSAAKNTSIAADLQKMPSKGRLFLRKIFFRFAAVTAADGVVGRSQDIATVPVVLLLAGT